jgi:soluble lytic murein transglycosylase
MKIVVDIGNLVRRTLSAAAFITVASYPSQIHKADAAVSMKIEIDPYLFAKKHVFNELQEKMNWMDEERLGRLTDVLTVESVKVGLDPLFVMAVIEAESNFDPEAISETGARGLMQLVKGTRNEWAEKLGIEHLESFNPEHNVKIGIHYLADLKKTFKKQDHVLYAYNVGPKNANDMIKSKEFDIVPLSYAKRIDKFYKRLLTKHNVKYTSVTWRTPNESIFKEMVN